MPSSRLSLVKARRRMIETISLLRSANHLARIFKKMNFIVMAMAVMNAVRMFSKYRPEIS